MWRPLLMIWRGVRDDKAFRGLALSVLLVWAAGTIFYALVEGWTVVDALYFSVLTLATVGYGDVVPTTVVSKLFTVGYVLLGIGLFAGFLTEIAARRRAAS